MKITALLAAGALALCAAPTTEARLGRRGRSLNRVRYDQDDDLGRWGGWNGAAAQAAAMAISGFSQGQLNGPSSGGYNPGFRNYNAPIVRLANDEDDDDLGGQSFSVSGGVSGQSGGTNYKNEWDEDDNLGRPVSAKCYFAQQRLCGYCGFESACRLKCNKKNEKALRQACGL